MVINSVGFACFFALVVVVMFSPPLRRSSCRQNAWLLLCSYVFYALADWRMVPLLALATVATRVIAGRIHHALARQQASVASRWTAAGVTLGVGLLLVFKYFNFFGESFAALLRAVGFGATWTTVRLVVPVGVSFFTFKLISYVIEVHRERVDPADDWLPFATYVAFFPTIMSGPIDRPDKFLPQLSRPHGFDYARAVDGCRQILWGVFLKMCLADNLAALVDSCWDTPSVFPAVRLLGAVLLFPLQLYADFGGYSHMAIGVGKVLGFDIARNFNSPLLGRNIAEFWQRWHISLTSWLTDYVFMPLNIKLRDWHVVGLIVAVLVNMVLIGFWHGADWTFGLFGLYFGLLYIPLIVRGKFGKKKRLKAGDRGWPQTADLRRMVATYLLVAVGFMLFKADNVGDFAHYCSALAHARWIAPPSLGLTPFAYCALVMAIGCEWLCRDREHPLQFAHGPAAHSRAVRWGIYYLLMVCVFFFQGQSQQFIYFQF